jgi:helix-turn-helix protein
VVGVSPTQFTKLIIFMMTEMTKTNLTSDELDALVTLMESFSWYDLSETIGLDVGECKTLLNKLIDMSDEVSDD